MAELEDPVKARAWVRDRMQTLPGRLQRAEALCARTDFVVSALGLSLEQHRLLQAAALCSQVGHNTNNRFFSAHPQLDAASQLQHAGEPVLASLVIGLETSLELATIRKLRASFAVAPQYQRLAELLAYLSVTTSPAGEAIDVEQWLALAARSAVGIGVRESVVASAERLRELTKRVEVDLIVKAGHETHEANQTDALRAELLMTMKGLEAIQ